MSIWHSLDSNTVIAALHTTPNGLDDQAVMERLQRDGPNTLPAQKHAPAWQQLLNQLYNPLIGILLCAAIMKVALQQWGDVIAIMFVVVFNALLSFFQESKAERSLQELRKLNAPKAHVMRNGTAQTIDASELVRGDCLLLESGTKIPADARLIESLMLEVDESLMTGESVPVPKTAQKLCSMATGVAEQNNMIFSGTIVTRGRGKAIVVATGTATHLASIAKITAEAAPPTSPLKERLDHFGKAIGVMTILLMGLILIIGIQRGFSLPELIMTCVSLTVSAVPEGLPIAVTVVLSIGLLTMARRKALIRKLPAVETLGCTTVICTDKTGTLTYNRMEVISSVIGGSSEPSGEALTWASRVAYFASEAHETGGHEVIGDPVDAALLRFGRKNNNETIAWEKKIVTPFESEARMMVASISHGADHFLLYKGSYETITSLCSSMYQGSAIVPFDRETVERQVQSLSGLRILALAFCREPVASETGITFIGLLGLEDPPRPEAKSAITACKNAGIHVAMITGDHKDTALAIARAVGLDGNSEVLTGSQLDTMDDSQLRECIQRIRIFARVTPHHKLLIVQQLQALGEVVAMTGDGVNDAPPLKAADIGIAMGTGTDVAKEAASMVILDNNFATIVQAIRQGRVIFKSLQQMASYLLTTCFGGVLTIAGSVLLSLPLPLLPLQLLWINLVTDGTTTVPLALEGEHGDIMDSPPRRRGAPFISRTILIRALFTSLVMAIGTIGLFAEMLYVEGKSLEYARTAAFLTLAFFQIFNALNARSIRRSLFFTYHTKDKTLQRIPFFQNKWLLSVIVVCSLLQIAAVGTPLLREFLSTSSLSIADWARVIGVSSLVIVATEIHKLIKIKLTQ